MFRLLVMCLLGFSGELLKTSGALASEMDEPLADMMSMKNEGEEMTAKSKRHHLHFGSPCPQLSSHPGAYLPPVYQKQIAVPSHHEIPKVQSIQYQKPMVPKMIYHTIQRPAVHHDLFKIQPIKQHVQYVQQPSYVPSVKEHQISYVKPVALEPTVPYGNVQKLFTNYVKPIQQIQQSIPMIHHPIRPTYAKEIPCEKPSTPVLIKSVTQMHSYYPKQLFQPIPYQPEPVIAHKPITVLPSHVNNFVYPTNNVLYQKPNLVNLHPQIIKAPEPDCEKIHEPKISSVKIPQAIIQNVHQPMYQYAPKYHQPAVVQQPMINFVRKLHQPEIVQQPIIHYQQPIVYGNNHQHSVQPVTSQVNYHGHNYQSSIISSVEPCHK